MTYAFCLASENVNSNYNNCAITKNKVQGKSKHTRTAYQKVSVYGIQPYLFIFRGHAIDNLLWLKGETLKSFGCQHTARCLTEFQIEYISNPSLVH